MTGKRDSEGRALLDAFASVGATQFDVTRTTRGGAKEFFRRNVKLADLIRALPSLLDNATAQQQNLIVRPHGPAVTFLQLDDLKTDMLARLAPAVFLILQTSPANFQAWAAIGGAEDKDFARRLRKGTGADATASGATRVAGSLNFKDKYAPDFPRVAIERVNAGRTTTPAELEQIGLVARPEARTAPRVASNRLQARPGNRKWPDYARCVEGAPLNGDKSGPDISRADFVWCMTAIDWGWSVEETAAHLVEESIKAQENGEAYAVRTAQNAAAAVERGRGLARHPRPGTPEQG